MVKNKALPDSPRLGCNPVWSLSFSLSLSPSQTWPYQGWTHTSSLSRQSYSSRGYPLDPAEAGPQQHSKGNHKLNEKTTHRMGENICKYCDQHGINLQNVQTAHTAHEPLWAEEPGRLQSMGWQRVGHG